jgi:endonuclease G
VGFTISFNPETKEPNWVGWHLTADHLNGPYKRPSSFFQDPDAGADSPTWEDYKGMGETDYQRGHMCPAEDCKWSEQSVIQSCYLTNICPQYGSLNGGDWKELETQCRRWAREYGDIYIVCGPIFYKGQHLTVCQSNMVVPEAFFKVVLCLQGEPKAIGFIYKNKPGNRPMGDYINSVDEIERITKIDFFPFLSNEVEKRVEAECDLNSWQ